MKKLIILVIAILSIFTKGSNGQSLGNGNLVIVGGGLEPENKAIFQQLIGLAGGVEKGTFAVIPSAGGTPVQSYVYFRNELIAYGVKPENIHLIPVALMDDDSTKNVNESEWKNNGDDPKLAGLVRKCTAVWFTGGDQARTMKTLVHPDGSQTPVLEAVWEVYRSGGVVGGTSAGAAIMSEVMIGGGTSMAALIKGVVRDYSGDDFPEDDGVWVTKGLGFFLHGVVDQHFNQRSRIGRLAVVLMNDKKKASMGFGVDENTALIYNGKQNKMLVAGAGGVTILNTSGARIFTVQNLPQIENLEVSYLEEGDGYDFNTRVVTPKEGKKPTRENEQESDPYQGQTGILSGSPDTFRDLMTFHLTDNKVTDTIQNINLINKDTGFLVTLSKTPSSEGFRTDKPQHGDHYTVTKVRMDITPVQISVKPMKNKY
jgi:cyanophycinase